MLLIGKDLFWDMAYKYECFRGHETDHIEHEEQKLCNLKYLYPYILLKHHLVEHEDHGVVVCP